MILIELEYEAAALRTVLNSFISPDCPVRPLYFSDDEIDVNRRKQIDDVKAFTKFFNNRTTGFFLFGPALSCFISVAPGKTVIVHCSLDANQVIAQRFIVYMALSVPLFGFACTPEEREEKNRITIKQGVNSIESWVGRNLDKYIPGLYWITLLPENLVHKHCISLSEIDKISLWSTKVGDIHIYVFYESPEDWLRCGNKIEEFCAASSGVFNIKKAKNELEKPTNFLEIHAMLRKYG